MALSRAQHFLTRRQVEFEFMTDDPRRRHLTPEEAAQRRRQAREQRGYTEPARPDAGYRDAGPQRPGAFGDRDARGRDPRNRAAPGDQGIPGARSGRTEYQPRQRPEPIPYEPVPDPGQRSYSRNRGARRDYQAGPPPVRDGRAPRDPRQPPAGRGGGFARPPRGAGRPKTNRRRRPLRIVAIVLALLLTLGVVTVIWADSKLQRIDALTNYDGRGQATPGTVTLLVGTDSREGLTAQQQAQLATGSESDAGGKRTDTMMLVYTPKDGGKTMLISLPRDLLVTVPGYGQNKLNAAYAFGGPQLLVQTLETQSGVRIDHYAEIGFGGFAGVVDSLGGVDLCLDQAIDDPLAGINLAPGCQTLTGPQALGFVRTRYGFAEQDLQRVRNQRQFMGALMKKMMSPGTLLNPFTTFPLLDSSTKAVTVDSGDHIWNLASMMWKLKNNPVTVTTPYDGMASGDVGSYLVWGPTTQAFFEAIAAGKTPPQSSDQPG